MNTVTSQDAVVSAEAAADQRIARARRDSLYRRFLAGADALAAVGAVLAAALVVPGARPDLAVLLATVPGIVVVSKLLGSYDREDRLVRKSALDEAPALFQAATLYVLMAWVAAGVLISGANSRRAALLILWGTLVVLLLVFRVAARRLSRLLTAPERCLVMGDAEACKWMEQHFARESSPHTVIVDRVVIGGAEPSLRMTSPELRMLVAQCSADRIVITPWSGDADQLVDVVQAAAVTGVKVTFMPQVLEVGTVEFDDLGGVPLLSMRPFGLTRSSRLIKRSFDLVGALLTLLTLLPLMAVIAAMIKLDSRGPVLFRQRRVGRDGAAFSMLKFRTMVPDAELRKAELWGLNEAEGLFKIARDPRITRVGRYMRRTSLDELPQLWNVLRGEMSLVGPRPLVAEEDRRIDGWHRRRLELTPGMTGHWQILGSARLPLREMVRIDYQYVNNWSLWLDLKILLRTIPYVLRRRGL